MSSASRLDDSNQAGSEVGENSRQSSAAMKDAFCLSCAEQGAELVLDHLWIWLAAAAVELVYTLCTPTTSDPLSLLLWFMPPAFIAVLARLMQQIKQRLGQQLEVSQGVVLQVATFICATAVCTYRAIHERDVVAQQRWLLLVVVPIFFVFTVVFHLPRVVHLWLNSPFFSLCWATFHASTGEVSFQAVLLLVGLCFTAWLLHEYLDMVLWERYQLAQLLGREQQTTSHLRQRFRQLVSTMNGVLNTTFDASCICDRSGSITYVTPALQSLLGGLDLLGCKLPSLASDEAQFQKVLQALSQAFERHEGSTILTLPVKLSPGEPPSDEKKEAPQPAVEIDVTMTCVVVPTGTSDRSSISESSPTASLGKEKRGLFVGVRADAVPNACPSTSSCFASLASKACPSQPFASTDMPYEDAADLPAQQPPPLKAASPSTAPSLETLPEIAPTIRVLGPAVPVPSYEPSAKEAQPRSQGCFAPFDTMSDVESAVSSVWHSSAVSDRSGSLVDIVVGRRGCSGRLPLSLLMQCPKNAAGEMLSIGSRLHTNEECVPCKFFTTKRGCLDGVLCRDCHYPHEDMSRSAKRRHVRRLRMEKRAALDREMQFPIGNMTKNTFVHIEQPMQEPLPQIRRSLSDRNLRTCRDLELSSTEHLGTSWTVVGRCGNAD